MSSLLGKKHGFITKQVRPGVKGTSLTRITTSPERKGQVVKEVHKAIVWQVRSLTSSLHESSTTVLHKKGSSNYLMDSSVGQVMFLTSQGTLLWMRFANSPCKRYQAETLQGQKRRKRRRAQKQ